MLTVKHIRMDGSEYTVQSSFAKYEPNPAAGPVRAVGAPDYRVVHTERDVFDGGTVFVMNDAGKTVARYDLGASPVPHNPSVDGLNCTTKAGL